MFLAFLSAFILFLFSISNNCLNIFFRARTLKEHQRKVSCTIWADSSLAKPVIGVKCFIWKDSPTTWRVGCNGEFGIHVFVNFQYLYLWLYKSKPTLVVFYPDIASQIKCLITRFTISKIYVKSPTKIDFEESYFKSKSLPWINFRGVIRHCRVIMHLLLRGLVIKVLHNLNQTF